MKLSKLSLTNFRSHGKTELALDKYNFVIGGNGAGKSSVAQAVQWLLTGVCDVTDQGGKGADDLVRAGEVSCDVSAALTIGDKSVEIKRSKEFGGVTELTVRNGKTLLIGPPAREWFKGLPPGSVLQAVLSATNFVELKADDQKKLLAQVLADDGVPIPKELAEYFERDKLTIAELDQTYKRAFDSRTALRRDLKKVTDIREPEGEAVDVKDVNERIISIRLERDAAVGERSTLLADFSTAATRKQVVTNTVNRLRRLCLEERENINTRRARLQAEYEALQPLTLEEEKELKKVVDAAPQTESITVALQAKLFEQDAVKKKIIKLAADAQCPMCTRPLTKAEATGLLRIIDGHIQTLEGQVKRSLENDKLRAAAAEAKKKISDSLSAAYQKEELQKDIANLPHPEQTQYAVDLREAEKELATFDDVPHPDTSDVDQRIKVFDERLALGQQVLLNATKFAEQMRQYNESVAEKERIEGDLATIEKVLAFAGPDGARKEAVGGKIGPFTESLNVALGQFGFQAAFTLDPFLMRVSKGGNLKLHVHMLSESEKFRFATAFQIALAQVTGIRLVVIDFADMLEKEARRELTVMLMEADIDQAIVCSTSTDPPPAEMPEGFKFFLLQNQDDTTVLA